MSFDVQRAIRYLRHNAAKWIATPHSLLPNLASELIFPVSNPLPRELSGDIINPVCEKRAV